MPFVHPIVVSARSWIGTRFAHQGRVKKTSAHAGGVDCLGLLVGVAQELSLQGRNGIVLSRFDQENYGHNPESYRLKDMLTQLLEPVPAEELTPGDIVLMTLEAHPQHLGIVSDYPTGPADEHTVLGLIHAYASARKVVEHRLDESWRARITDAFRVAAISPYRTDVVPFAAYR